ncbi:MAG TPA: diaminopimelate epimerase [Chromatiales bacterium]|nr:diaminopimelate epimerase [Chromatiales bacterium]
MKLRFTKMQGLGNDFVVLDATRGPLNLTPEHIRRLADRRYGVGCDQVLVVEPPPAADVEFGYRIFNADGGEVEQCGNGARCFARYVRERGLTHARRIPVQTRAGRIVLEVEEDGRISVHMGVPRLEPGAIPIRGAGPGPRYQLEVDGQVVTLTAVSMGNPHAVVEVEDMDRAPVAELGPALERHPAFPHGANVGFMQLFGPRRVRLRVWERGVGETLACGTGACAAVVAGRLAQRLAERVEVELPGGRLEIQWPGPGSPVRMTGPAETVFEGEIEL